MLAGTMVVSPAVAAPAAQPAAASGPPAAITLLTGDKVVLGGPRGAVIEPADGRERLRFVQQRDESGDLHVIPEDALPLLNSHRIDPRLFNVTKLVQSGYDDRTRKDLPLIVSGGEAQARGKVRDLPSVGGSAVRMNKAAGFGPLTSAQRIWLDGPVHAALDKSVPQVGAPQAWQAGHTGKGTTVAVLDTGIDATHPDLADAVVGAQDFTGSATGADDQRGHGTHVASIITGAHQKYPGVAPDTKLLNGKVLADSGIGTESSVIAGMEWAVTQGTRVVNMSLGTIFPSDGKDPMSLAVNRLTAETGALFVVAAGNRGTLAPGAPGAADAALTVGAVDHDERLASFSSRGPRLGDGAIKPDITAPGVDIAAAKAAHATAGKPVDDTHVRLSGTSMATPHVAGAAAILMGQHPDWKADQLKSVLMNSARPSSALSVFEQGAGRLDVAKAVTQNVYSSPTSLSQGTVQWPHDDDTPITRTVTYRNSGTTPVTLDMRTDIRGPDGNPAPAGMFTLSPATVTVPAGGQADVTVTTDTRVGGPDGSYSGAILAGDLRVPIAVNREVESYDYTFEMLDFDGRPASQHSLRLVGLDRPGTFQLFDPSGTVVARLPKGRYVLDSVITGPKKFAIADEPEYVIDKPGRMTIDARTAKQAGFVVDKPNAKGGDGSVGFESKTASAIVSTSVYTSDFTDVFVRPSATSATTPGQFRYIAEARMAEPDGKGGFSTSTYLYNLRHETDGRVPDDLVQRVSDTQLAKVRSEHAATGAGATGTRERMITRQLPFTLDEFYTPNVPWLGQFEQASGPDRPRSASTLSTVVSRTFKPGHTTERWNFGAFGPALPRDPGNPAALASRLGDYVTVALPLHADREPNHQGFSDSTGSTSLSRDGMPTSTLPTPGVGVFAVPADPGVYHLHTESVRDTPLSSRITVDWTFHSSTVPGDQPAALPLMAVRFAPPVDDQNRVPRAVPTFVPLTVDHYTGGTAKAPEVDVSYDNGTTWQSARVLTIAGRSFTLLIHPPTATSVSVRAKTSDTSGNSVNQTIIGAFLLK
ncbi:S8 family serine peptidase [Kibdelosporangium persicum]